MTSVTDIRGSVAGGAASGRIDGCGVGRGLGGVRLVVPVAVHGGQGAVFVSKF